MMAKIHYKIHPRSGVMKNQVEEPTFKEVAYVECHQAENSSTVNRYEYMFYYVNRSVEVEHSSPSSDYQSLMYTVNIRKITHR